MNRKAKQAFRDHSLGYCKQALGNLIAKENRDQMALSALKLLPRPFSFLSERQRLRESLTETRREKDLAAREMTMLLNCLRKNRSLPLVTRDEEPYSMAIGCVYGKCVCLDEAGSLLYVMEKEGGVQIGHLVQSCFLIPLSSLPLSQQNMIVRSLLRIPDTPGFARKIINKKKKELEEDHHVSQLQSEQSPDRRPSGAGSGA